MYEMLFNDSRGNPRKWKSRQVSKGENIYKPLSGLLEPIPAYIGQGARVQPGQVAQVYLWSLGTLRAIIALALKCEPKWAYHILQVTLCHAMPSVDDGSRTRANVVRRGNITIIKQHLLYFICGNFPTSDQITRKQLVIWSLMVVSPSLQISWLTVTLLCLHALMYTNKSLQKQAWLVCQVGQRYAEEKAKECNLFLLFSIVYERLVLCMGSTV